MNATIEVLLEKMISLRSVHRGYKEAGSNTSTVASGVVGGDVKGTRCLGV
jgi:hypothetical protein